MDESTMTLKFNSGKRKAGTVTAPSWLYWLRGPRGSTLRVLSVTLLGLVLTACGGGGASSEQDIATRALAEQNQVSLNLSDDLAITELLHGETGAITNLGEVVTGDRPVLVWYWAPN